MKELKLIIKERVHSTHFEMNIHHVMKEIHTYEDKVILEKNVFFKFNYYSRYAPCII